MALRVDRGCSIDSSKLKSYIFYAAELTAAVL